MYMCLHNKCTADGFGNRNQRPSFCRTIRPNSTSKEKLKFLPNLTIEPGTAISLRRIIHELEMWVEYAEISFLLFAGIRELLTKIVILVLLMRSKSRLYRVVEKPGTRFCGMMYRAFSRLNSISFLAMQEWGPNWRNRFTYIQQYTQHHDLKTAFWVWILFVISEVSILRDLIYIFDKNIFWHTRTTKSYENENRRGKKREWSRIKRRVNSGLDSTDDEMKEWWI